MCLAIPGKIVSREGDIAKIDFGGSVQRDANVSLVDAEIGEYVIVHAGFAIQKLNHEEAQESLDLWQELLEQSG
jgi:hydrogenase expression/formation protein HypC